METAKVRVKFGSLEVDYEGNSSFVGEGLLALISDVVSLSKQAPLAAKGTSSAAHSLGDDTEIEQSRLTISTIAAHLTPDGPQDLVMCALGRLQIVEGRAQVTKTEIFDEMKKATSYFKSSMANNFSRDLNRMVKAKRINEVSSNTYSLTAASRQELEPKIAGIS